MPETPEIFSATGLVLTISIASVRTISGIAIEGLLPTLMPSVATSRSTKAPHHFQSRRALTSTTSFPLRDFNSPTWTPAE